MNKNTTSAAAVSTKQAKKAKPASKESLKALIKIKSGLQGGKIGCWY